MGKRRGKNEEFKIYAQEFETYLTDVVSPEVCAMVIY